MSNNIVYKGDIGTVVLLDTGMTITGATAITVEALKPSGTISHWTATVHTDNVSVKHTIVSGEFDEVGTYTLQAKLTLGGGTWRGESVKLIVKDLFR